MSEVIILDNGHGEETAGKRSPLWGDGSQLFEWEFNRDIVRRIAAMLKAEGIKFEILADVQTLSMQSAATTPFCVAFMGTPEAAPGGNVTQA